MENQDHYEALAEHMWFNSLSSSNLTRIAKYKSGRTFEDVKREFEKGKLDGIGSTERQISLILT